MSNTQENVPEKTTEDAAALLVLFQKFISDQKHQTQSNLTVTSSPTTSITSTITSSPTSSLTGTQRLFSTADKIKLIQARGEQDY